MSERRPMKNRAFSLIELLMVMAVIAIVVALTLPAFQNFGKAQALTGAGSNLLDQLALARQTAVARNRTVELRIYQRRENPAQAANESANPARFRSFRAMIYEEPARDGKGNMVAVPFALTTMQDLPTGVVISEEQPFSTLIFPYDTSAPPRPLLRENLSDVEQDVPYQVVRFKATGGTDLGVNGTPDGDKWFLSMKFDNDPPVGSGESARPANNYYTIMLDPVSGRARAYRP
jgi:uncharacterized protein (TIGR02596 family)